MSQPKRERKHGTPTRTPEQQPSQDGVDRSAEALALIDAHYTKYPRSHRNSHNSRRASDGEKVETQGKAHGKRALVYGALALTAMNALIYNVFVNDSDTEKEKAPVVTEAPEIETEGTVPWAPEENDGYRAGVLKEAQDSGITLSEEQLDKLVEDARLLNPNPQYEGRYLEPQLGEQMNLPNIIGPGGVDQTPPEQP